MYSNAFGVGTVQRPLYNVRVNVQGIDRPIRVRFVLKDEFAVFGVRNNINTLRRMGRSQNPFQVGQSVRVEFDSRNPKRGNII